MPLESTGQQIPLQEWVLRRIRLLSQRRIAWLRKIWSEINQGTSESFDAHMEIDGYLYNADIPSAEMQWISRDPEMKELSLFIRETEQELRRQSRLSVLINTFGLSNVEMDVLQLCLAFSIDPNLGRVFAYMQDHSGRSYITETLAARLFGHGQCLLLDAGSPLKIWGLVRETITTGEPVRLECDPFIRNWILGSDGLDETLAGFSYFQPVKKPLTDWPVNKVVEFINRVASGDAETRIRIFVAGSEGSGRKSFAAIVCKQLGLSLLSVNTDRIPEVRWQQVYINAQRQALLSNAALAWHGANINDRYWPLNISSCRLQFVIGEADDFIEPGHQFVDLRVDIPVIRFRERLALWQKFAPVSSGWPKEELEAMIQSHQANIGQIVAIGQKMVPGISEAYEALRANAAHRLGNLAQQIKSDFSWDDLVIPEHVKAGIEDFTYEATERIRFWEQPGPRRLFPQGRSLIALFTGSPGTGKTMAAQVIAAALKLDLFRIDLSTIVSKYIGESSKNIERILSRAATMDIVLLFDEADALFGKRTEINDAHDRYANTDTNYLLQAIEQYPGVIILASNKKSNIDSGFMRRFRYVIDFPRPGAEHRLQLWKGILMELAGEKAAARLSDELQALAESIEITGAQIKLSVLSALFMARREGTDVSLSHLLKGLERELIKEGKGLGRQLQERLNTST